MQTRDHILNGKCYNVANWKIGQIHENLTVFLFDVLLQNKKSYKKKKKEITITRSRWQKRLSSYEGKITYELRNLASIQAGSSFNTSSLLVY